MLVNLPPTLIMNYIFLGQKSSIDFSPHFSPFYPDRVTSESYNNPLKVIPEGSMVEYLPVGSKEGPQTIIGQKKFSSPKFLNHTPSPLCTVVKSGFSAALRSAPGGKWRSQMLVSSETLFDTMNGGWNLFTSSRTGTCAFCLKMASYAQIYIK